jgi:hypothetical protein
VLAGVVSPYVYAFKAFTGRALTFMGFAFIAVADNVAYKFFINTSGWQDSGFFKIF